MRGRVFVSYRREDGAHLARSIREALKKRRFDVFMDVEDLRGGAFNTALLKEIAASTDVLVILTPGALDRSLEHENDWLRLEIAHALKQEKNVVPILTPAFRWPDRPLPDDLRGLPVQNGLTVSHEYFDASVDRLADRLLVGRPRSQSWARSPLVLAAAVSALVIGLAWWFLSEREVSAPDPIESTAISAPLPSSSTTPPPAIQPAETKPDICQKASGVPSPGPVWPPPDALWRAQSPPDSGRYVLLESEEGDYIGGGKTYAYTPMDAEISLSGAPCQIQIQVEGDQDWSGEFVAMNGLRQLQRGYYGALQRYPFHNPTKGGLNWSGEGRGCNTLSGWFVIDEIAFTAGKISRLDLRFEQRCDEHATAMHGSIHWSP